MCHTICILNFLSTTNEHLCFSGGNADIRFSKLKFDSNVPIGHQRVLPLTKDDFPLTDTIYQTLKYSTAISPVLQYDKNVKASIPDLIENVMGGFPPHPGNSETSEYWFFFRHILDLQLYRRQDDQRLASTTFPVPDLWNNFTLWDAAKAVHDEVSCFRALNIRKFASTNSNPHTLIIKCSIQVIGNQIL